MEELISGTYCPEECKVVVEGRDIYGLADKFLEQHCCGFDLRILASSDSVPRLEDAINTVVTVDITAGLYKQDSMKEKDRITTFDISGDFYLVARSIVLSTDYPVVVYHFENTGE